MILRGPVLCLGLLACIGAFAEDLLGEISLLARGGTPDLAIQLMNRHQPSLDANPPAWMRWERERAYIYQSHGEWEALVAHFETLPADLSEDFVTWVDTAVAEAYLELGRGEAARTRLLPLMWNPQIPGWTQRLPQWRQLAIRSYLLDGRVDDAHTAMLKYQLDHGDDDESWRVLRGRVLVRAGRAHEAVEVLRDVRSPEGQVIALIAPAMAGELSAVAAGERAAVLMRSKEVDARDAYELWGVLATVRGWEGDSAGRVRALEQAVALRRHMPPGDFVVEADGNALWEAYLAHAEETANRAQLLIGQFDRWFMLAESHRDDGEAVTARALYAYLALNAPEAQERSRAHEQLVALLAEEEWRLEVLRALYLSSDRFPTLSSVPASARYTLADLVLGESDIQLASQLLEGLSQAPPGVEPQEWRLRRARVFILAGNTQAGAADLKALVLSPEAPAPEMVDRINQVVFDLQTVGEHEQAYGLLAGLLARATNPQLRRELLYWMAESQAALGNYEDASVLYLKSAMSDDPFSMDPWAQTARYQAAEVLGRAGLTRDAGRVYEELLGVTQDPARRAVIQRAIQRLWLEDGDGFSP